MSVSAARVVDSDLLIRDLRHMAARAAPDLADWLVHLELEGKADRTLYGYTRAIAPLLRANPDTPLEGFTHTDINEQLRLIPERSRHISRSIYNQRGQGDLLVKPRLLDLFCGAGGAAVGYHRAGFEVVGVDIKPQPNYPFEFRRGDALEVFDWCAGGHMMSWIDDFDAIHASPPCQAFTVYNNTGNVGDYPDLIQPTRELLRTTGLPYVIENVPGAPLKDPVRICGTSLGLEVRRHRLFETNFPLIVPPCAHGQFTERKYPGSTNRPNGRTVANVGEWRVPLEQQKLAMGVDWMTLEELSEAIPPTYTELIGHQLMQHLQAVAA